MEDYEKKKNQRKVGIYGIIFSTGLILLCTYSLLGSYIFRQNAIFIKGEVVDYVENKKNNKPSSYTPIIQYIVGDKIIKIEGQVYGNRSEYEIGQEVSVCYNPKNPAEGRLDSFKEAYQFQLLFLGGVLISLIVGIHQYNKYKAYK